MTIRLTGTEPLQVRARFAVLATGADTSLGRKAGLATAPTPSAVAVRCYVRSAFEIDRLMISYDRDIVPGYAWIFPLPDGEYNVGCGVFYRNGMKGDVNLRKMFERFVAGFPEARELMAGATDMTPLKGAPLRCGLMGLDATLGGARGGDRRDGRDHVSVHRRRHRESHGDRRTGSRYAAGRTRG